MKLAIKVLTEWDRLNVIPFFEKHYPNCNKWEYEQEFVDIGEVWYIHSVSNGLTYRTQDEFRESDYTILQGVPEDMELPTLEPNKTREQELEDFVYRTLNMVDNITFPTESELKDLATQAKQLLNK